MRDVSGLDEIKVPDENFENVPDENICSARSPSRGARYQKRYRARQRKRKAVLGVEVDSDKFVGALLRAGWLSPAQALNRRNLEVAASDIIAEWQRRWRG